MKRVDTSNVMEADEYASLPAGAYICVIRDAKDEPEKERLTLHYDIAQGEHKGYFDDFRDRKPDNNDWIGRLWKSYKPKALPFFKRFCSAVSKSNGNYVFDGGSVNADEHTLIGKKIGLVFREEEYYSNSGELKTKLEVYKEFPIDKIEEQKIPPILRIKEDKEENGRKSATNTEFMNVPEGSDEEVPFE